MNEPEDIIPVDKVASDPTDDPADAHTQQPAAPATAASVAKASLNGRIEAQAIAEICLIAGSPQRTAEFLASGMTEGQVRRVLLNARAEQPDITSHLTADAGMTLRPENSPVVAAVKKLNAKEM